MQYQIQYQIQLCSLYTYNKIILNAMNYFLNIIHNVTQVCNVGFEMQHLFNIQCS